MNPKILAGVGIGALLLFTDLGSALLGGFTTGGGGKGTVGGGVTPISNTDVASLLNEAFDMGVASTKKDAVSTPESFSPPKSDANMYLDYIDEIRYSSPTGTMLPQNIPNYITETLKYDTKKGEFTSKVDNPNATYYNIPAVTNLGAGSPTTGGISHTVPVQAKKQTARQADQARRYANEPASRRPTA